MHSLIRRLFLRLRRWWRGDEVWAPRPIPHSYTAHLGEDVVISWPSKWDGEDYDVICPWCGGGESDG